MKTIIIMAIFSIVYLIAMEIMNQRLSALDLNKSEGLVYTTKESSYYSATIKGAVNNPGTYTVTKGATLGYLITLAGGVTDEADVTSYNDKVVLNSNGVYYISKIKEDGTKISINTASVSSLDTLPGIGSVLATRIVSYRNQNGEFTSIEDIKKVQGIGDALFDQIKDLITL